MHVFVEQSRTNDAATIIRMLRVFRVLRFLRIFRLFHARRLSADREVSVEVAERMHKINTLLCFARAHLRSEVDCVRYFGGNGKIDDPETESEIARCILQSQCSVYSALALAVKEQK